MASFHSNFLLKRVDICCHCHLTCRGDIYDQIASALYNQSAQLCFYLYRNTCTVFVFHKMDLFTFDATSPTVGWYLDPDSLFAPGLRLFVSRAWSFVWPLPSGHELGFYCTQVLCQVATPYHHVRSQSLAWSNVMNGLAYIEDRYKVIFGDVLVVCCHAMVWYLWRLTLSHWTDWSPGAKSAVYDCLATLSPGWVQSIAISVSVCLSAGVSKNQMFELY